MKPLRWGVIGAGGIARRRTVPEGILPAKNARLVALADCDAQTRSALRQLYGVPAVATAEELLALPLDAVYVATPTFEHAAHVRAAAAAGVHVLCEKPLALDVEQAVRMAATCRSAGVKLGVGYMMRFHPAHQQIQTWLEAGRIGTPVVARAQLACWHPPAAGHWRQVRALGGGGALADLALHCLDLLEFMLGPIVEITALTSALVQRYEDDAVEDSGVVALRFENGALGVVEAQFNVPDAASENVLEITGTQGGIRAAHTIGQGSGGELRTSFGRKPGQASAWKVWPLDRGPNIYRAEIEAFSRSIQRGTEPPVSGAAGVRGMRLLAACYEAARCGKTISVREAAPMRKRPTPKLSRA
jgi:predicted dehydrogenase